MTLRRIASALVIAGLAGATALAASAAGPSPGVQRDGTGIAVAGGARIVAGKGVNGTTVSRIRVSDGKIVKQRSLGGILGIPLVTYTEDSVEGTWAQGRRLVLATSIYDNASSTTFVVIDTRTLKTLRTIRLRGAFGYDALSPGGRRMYVLEFPGGVNGGIQYVVRSVDLVTGKLEPGKIVDKTEPAEQMSGLPMARAIGERGWVYTLYRGTTSHAFVHALDTRNRAARCLDLPWTGEQQNGLETVQMTIADGILTLREPSVGVLARIDTRTFAVEVVRAPEPTGTP
jgi:hypothetical protein